jgi:flagellar hook assembly protein FlgD
MDLFVTDTVTGKRISVRSAGAYQFDAVAGGTRRFVLEAKTQSTGALAVSRVRTIPGATRSAGYRFGITTTVATDITVDIQTVTGRSVRSLITRSAGMKESTVAWDGRDADGRDIPAGAYVVIVRATDSDGRVVTHRVPMTTIR